MIDAANGMGMTETQRLWKVEAPLAAPVILEGVRLSIVIALATATIGSTVAAKGLGEVIIAGLLSNNLSFIVQGGVVVALLAIILYDALSGGRAHLGAPHRPRRQGASLMSDFDLVLAGAVVLPDRLVERGFVAARDGKIALVGRGEPPAARERHIFGRGLILPGAIDAQVHSLSQKNQEDFIWSTRVGGRRRRDDDRRHAL